MPTSKPRITITVTGELEEVLAVERLLHPELSPSELVGLLIRRGHEAGLSGGDRRALVESLAGGEQYPTGERGALRDEWPA